MLTSARYELLERMRNGGHELKIVPDRFGQLHVGDQPIRRKTIVDSLVADGYVKRNSDGTFELTTKGRTARGKNLTSATTPRPRNLVVYLGTAPHYTIRKEALERLAEEYGGLSKMVQMIADEELKLVRG